MRGLTSQFLQERDNRENGRAEYAVADRESAKSCHLRLHDVVRDLGTCQPYGCGDSVADHEEPHRPLWLVYLLIILSAVLTLTPIAVGGYLLFLSG